MALTGLRDVGYAHLVATDPLITQDPEVLGGVPVFRNTRVPVKTLFDYLANNYTLDEFLECFPSVSREMALRALEKWESSLLSSTRK